MVAPSPNVMRPADRASHEIGDPARYENLARATFPPYACRGMVSDTSDAKDIVADLSLATDR